VSKFMLKTLSISACLAWSGYAAALGIGNINVTSALGQPLKADIDLVAVTKAEKASLVARLASPDSYKNAGLDYPYGNKFKFELANRDSGEPYLKVTTDRPIQDPFVVMMVELNWAAGRLVREFTFLLDPPNYVAEQPAASVQPVVPSAPAVVPVVPGPAAAAAQPAPVTAVPEPAVEPVAAPESEPVVAQQRVDQEAPPVAESAKPEPAIQEKPIAAAQPAPSSATPRGRFDIEPSTKKVTATPKVTADSYVVQRGDTLSKIATDNMPGSVSLERALVALYRANVDQFDGQNMNRLSKGKQLHLPTEKEISSITQADAVTEIRAQAEDWNAYRQKLAGAATASSQSQTAQQVATGKISSSVADKAPIVQQAAQEVLKLSKGEMPSDKAVTTTAGKKPTAQEQKSATRENEIAGAKAAKEAETRVALLEKNLKDMEKLSQLKVEAAALTQKQTPAPVTVATPAAAPAPVAASAVAASKPKPAVKPVNTPEVKPEESLLDTILSEPTYLGGVGAGLLALLGLGWYAARRRRNAEPQFEDALDVTQDIGARTGGHMAVPVPPSPETGDFTRAEGQVVAQAAEHGEEDVDPISEADLFLNFGRDAQAEEILKEALGRTPEIHQIHMRLLGIYANRKDTAAFENIARQLKDSGDEMAFSQACQMGRGIDPGNALYGKPIPIEDASSATMQAPAFDVIPPTPPETPSKPAEVDFDIGAATGVLERQAAEESTQKTPAASQPEEELPNLDDLIFDVTGSHPTLKMDKAPDTVAQESSPLDMGINFTLDQPPAAEVRPSEPPKELPKAEVIDFAGISLNLEGDDTTVNAPAQPGEDKGGQWQEVATKLDLAKAYQEMGDAAGAREILEEVLREGDVSQRQVAQELLAQVA